MKWNELINTIHVIKNIKRDSDCKTYAFSVKAYDAVIKKISAVSDPNADISHADIEQLAVTPYMKSLFVKIVFGDLEMHLADKGITPTTSKLLISAGLSDIKSLSEEKYMRILSEREKAHLIYKPANAIPRELIERYQNTLTDGGRNVIAGSFRRGAKTSSDIDVICVGQNGSIGEYIKTLGAVVLAVYENGEDKVSAVIKLGKVKCKMDVFRVSADEFAPMLLYATGPKQFNIVMRKRAKSRGLTLNQRGLFKKKIKINTGHTEEGIFAALDMEFLPPAERV